MRFSQSLWDGSDPLYAPCTRKAKKWLYWTPPPLYVKNGYHGGTIRLPGELGDGADAERAAKARELTRDMVQWYQGDAVPHVLPETWKWLIARYLSDEFSPYQDLRGNTQTNYRFCINRWDEAIGATRIDAADLPTIKGWQKAMHTNGRSVSYIKRMFTTLRIIVGYGVQIKAPGARDVREILGELRIRGPKPRTVSPTVAQIDAIIAAADKAGDAPFALGLSLQWWLTLRAMDVRGDFIPVKSDEERGGIMHHGSRWQNGLTWNMIDSDATELRKVPSKTEGDMPEELVFDLTLIPALRARLLAVPPEKRVGPVIVRRDTGEPYDRHTWSKAFRAYATAAGVPAEVKLMDTRAGAINHAKRLGASHIEMQHQAHHRQATTTDRYIRERSESVNNVLRMRAEK